MAFVSDKLSIVPSVFDRLLDDRPYLSSDGVPGIRRNPAVRAVADKSIGLSGLQLLDGVDLADGDRVLLVSQAPNLRNGVYLVSEEGWLRATSPDSDELIPGAYWDVNEGYDYGKTQWRLVNTQDIILETTPIVIERFVPKSQFQTVNELKTVVARDLEFMLNTHREGLFNMTENLPEASHSLVNYGVPDFSTFDIRNPQDCRHVCVVLKELINDFEPRLKQVAVTLTPPQDHAQNLHFRLDAVLEVHPAREQVVFDAVLQLNSKSYQIEGI